MQGTTGRLGVDPRALRRLPVPFQRVPHRAPVLRGRFHHHFLDLTLDQPRGEQPELARARAESPALDRKSTRLNSSHVKISYAVFCLKKKRKGRDSTVTTCIT